MQLRQVRKLFASITCGLVILCAPMHVVAEGLVGQTVSTPAAPILITEVQTGAATASDEFVELYNTSDSAIDLSGWQIRYANSTVTDGTSTALATIASGVMLPSHTHFVLHTASLVLPAGGLSQVYSAGLSKTDKTVALFAPDQQTCTLTVQDAVAWEGVEGTTQGEGDAVATPAATVSKDKLLQRYRDSAGTYIDTNNNATDFALSTMYATATPGASNENVLLDPPSIPGVVSALSPAPLAGCTLPGPVTDTTGDSPPSVTEQSSAGADDDADEALPTIPAENVGLRSPQLSELLPNPGLPQTDAADEFIELYNPNDGSFDLGNYVLEAGIATKHRFTIPRGTTISGHAFMAFFSGDTHLALSNTSGQVRVLDPLGAVLVESDAYASAKDGQAWVLANGSWQWTTKPTPNAINALAAPIVKAKTASAKAASRKVKAATTANHSNNTSGSSGSQLAVTTAPPRDPIHPAVLAVIAVSAVLYGAYEYRNDLANKIHQLRSNRAARRAAGQSVKGR